MNRRDARDRAELFARLNGGPTWVADDAGDLHAFAYGAHVDLCHRRQGSFRKHWHLELSPKLGTDTPWPDWAGTVDLGVDLDNAKRAAMTRTEALFRKPAEPDAHGRVPAMLNWGEYFPTTDTTKGPSTQ